MKIFKRIVLGLLAILLIGFLILFFGIAPGFVFKTVNRVNTENQIEVSDGAKSLHNSLKIVDSHNDSLMWAFDLNQKSEKGHSDIPRLLEGGVRLQVFSTVTQSMMEPGDSNTGDSPVIGIQSLAQLQPPSTWFSSYSRALYQAEKLADFEEDSNGILKIIRTKSDLMEVLETDRKILGALLAVEGMHSIEGDMQKAEDLFNAGFRVFGLTHFFDNEFAGSANGMEKGGLTPLGRDLVSYAEAKGIIMDLSHASDVAVRDVLAYATKPIMISHAGIMGACEARGNLSDEILSEVASKGGLIGVGFWKIAVCDASPKAIAKSIRYLSDLVGVDHVALGSDFNGAVRVPFDASGFSQLTQALIEEGFNDEEIGKIMGENAFRFFSELLP